jgi:hypothetical protein
MEANEGAVLRLESIDRQDYIGAHNSMPTTVNKAVEVGLPMIVTEKACDGIVAQIEFEIIELMKKVNIDQRLNIQTHQVPAIAQELFDEFKRESIEDIAVCLKRGAMGHYGEIYRLDGAVIAGWMRKYLDEKYEILVNNLNAEKESPYDVSRGAKTDIMLKLMKEALGDYKDPDKVNQQHLAEHRLRAREEMKKRNDFQKLINRTASEFYKDRESVNIAQYVDDETGFHIPAENEKDAESIYLEAKKHLKI